MATAKDLIISTETLNDLVSTDGAFQHIDDTYDLNIFPVTISNPTGKALRASFEDIDLKLYHPNTMVAFRIGPDPDRHRMMCWLKALWVFYEYLRSQKSYKIDWKTFETPKKKLKNIDILVQQRGESYRISFYVTSGTVQAQGKQFQEFAHDHFHCIKYLFLKIHKDTDKHSNALVPKKTFKVKVDAEIPKLNNLNIEHSSLESEDEQFNVLVPDPSKKNVKAKVAAENEEPNDLNIENSSLQLEVNDLKSVVKETQAACEALKDENEEMKKKMRDLEERLKRLEIDNKENNVIIAGLDIGDDEVEGQIEEKLKEMFVKKLGLNQEIEIERVMQTQRGYLVVKLRNIKDKDILIKAAGERSDCGINITSDYSNQM